MTQMKLSIILVSIILVSSSQTNAQKSINSYSSDVYETFSDDGAWCWFSDPRAIHFNGKIYSGWVSADGSIMVASYDEKNGEINDVNFYPKFNKDDHANPSFLILPDKRIMMFFSSHNGKGNGEKEPAILYAISKNPEDISEWNKLQRKTENVDGTKGFCYTNPIMLSEENNRIYIFWRGANWKPIFSYTDDFGLTWSKSTSLIKSSLYEEKRPYVKITSNGKDEIHFAFTDGHPRNEPLNSVYYLKYKEGKFYKADGTLIGSLDNLPVEHEDCDMVYDANKPFLKNRFGIRSWIWDIANDENGNPVLVYSKLPTESEHSYWYAKWNGQEWVNSKISDAGSWFPRFERTKSEREPEPHYSGGVNLDHENTNVVFYSKPVGDVFEIFTAKTQNSGKDWEISPITSNSKKDNVRPFAIRGANEDARVQVLWMRNNRYSHYKDYNTQIKMNLARKNK
jgi:hypothetical protein